MANPSEVDLAAMLVNNKSLKLKPEFRLSVPRQQRQTETATSPCVPLVPVAAVAEPQGAPKADISGTLPSLTFMIPGAPCPKPRQTKSDKWKKRPSVLRYRDWADRTRAEARKAVDRKVPGLVLRSYGRMKAVAFFALPSSWNAATKARMLGRPHCQRPDADNLMKAIGDGLFPTGDEHLYDLQISKYWDDGGGARTVITLF